MSTYTEANEIEFFNECLDKLVEDLFRRDIDEPDENLEISLDELDKSAWIASILASSDIDEHRKKALSFSILAYLRQQGTPDEKLFERYLYVILSRLGDLPAVGNLVDDESREEFEYDQISSFDTVLSTELESNRQLYSLGDGDYLSEFQNEIYRALRDKKDIAISGPTSSGKSFILQRFIREKVREDGKFEVIYVVPTRALISEVSNDLKGIDEDITVKTGAYFSDEDDDENVFLVATPERCLKLLREDTSDNINPSLVFFDEIQNIEDGERGVLFETVIESLHEIWPEMQIVAAGPYLDDPGSTLRKITGKDVEEITTVFTPIFQLKIILRFEAQNKKKNRKLDVVILSPSGEEVQFKIDEPPGLTFSKVKGNKKKSLGKILDRFAEGEKNLVYASQKNYAEQWAERLKNEREYSPQSDRTRDLTDFLATAIHEEYTLIDCLKHGVAFHHGMVPKIARTEIEDIYREENDLNTIVSTPTLLQGVNLPAKNMFVLDPTKGRKELTDFDFKNLIGRVGRLNHWLYGSIYCIETNEKEWSSDKLGEKENKEVVAATTKALQDDKEKLLRVVDSENIYEVDDSHLRYTSILLRNKHLKEGHDLEDYLKKNEFDQDEIDEVRAKLNDRLKNIKIPEKILRRNPTTDPIQQDKLYKAVKHKPEIWTIANNKYQFSYDRFLDITRKLNQIFLFTNDPEYNVTGEDRETNHGHIIPISITANYWLQGDSYRKMIEARQNNENVGDKDINTSIKKVIEMVNDDIRFILVKYYRILTDILEEVNPEASTWMLNFDQMLEMGSIDFNRLELMAKGADRTVVVDLRIPDDVDDVVGYLRENKNAIPPFYANHLEEQGIL